MEMQMLVLDGYNAVRNLRDAGYDGPIVALTAHTMAGDRDRCFQAGCNEYCTKPINRKRLIAVAAKSCNPPLREPQP